MGIKNDTGVPSNLPLTDMAWWEKYQMCAMCNVLFKPLTYYYKQENKYLFVVHAFEHWPSNIPIRRIFLYVSISPRLRASHRSSFNTITKHRLLGQISTEAREAARIFASKLILLGLDYRTGLRSEGSITQPSQYTPPEMSPFSSLLYTSSFFPFFFLK